MGAALELLSGSVTAPSTTLTALTMATGNSLTIRQTQGNRKAKILSVWNKNQTAGTLRILSTKMHDNVAGVRLTALAAEPLPLLPDGVGIDAFSQDTFAVTLSGSGTAGDIESAHMLVYYPDLPGNDANLITPDQVMSRMIDIMTVENTLALGTGGGYTGEEAINAEFDQFKANEDYALLGYQVSALCGAIRWRGSETSQLGVGGPGNEARPDLTRSWFMDLSRIWGLPLVPVFNAANKAAILLDGVQDEDGADVTVHSIFARLGRSF